MNINISNAMLQSIRKDALEGYDAVKTGDTDKNNRKGYVTYDAGRGTFAPAPKPGWLSRIFHTGGTDANIDQTRKVFLRAVVDEFARKQNLSEGVPGKDASIKELIAFAESKFSDKLKKALKLDDFGKKSIRIPLSKYRVDTVLDELQRVDTVLNEIQKVKVGNVDDLPGDSFVSDIKVGARQLDQIDKFQNGLLPGLATKLMTRQKSEASKPQLLQDIEKFLKLCTAFFGDGRKVLDHRYVANMPTVNEVLEKYTPEAFMTAVQTVLNDSKKNSAERTEAVNAICEKWKGNPITSWLASAVSRKLRSEKEKGEEKESFYDALKKTAVDGGFGTQCAYMLDTTAGGPKGLRAPAIGDALGTLAKFILNDMEPALNVEKPANQEEWMVKKMTDLFGRNHVIQQRVGEMYDYVNQPEGDNQ